MGTHISRVKSVDLDAWTDEQLQSVLRWGNARANKYWEAKLAPGHVPSEAKIENFIRTKYESKRWVMDGGIPDPSTLDAEGDDDVPLNLVQEKAKLDRSSSTRASTSSQPAPRVARPAQNVDLFGDDTAPLPARPNTTEPSLTRPPPNKVPPTPPKPMKQGDSLLGLDLFGPSQSASPARSASATPNPSSSTVPSRPDLKQSILSLYASAPRPPPKHTQSGSVSGPTSPPLQQQSQQSGSGGLIDAFAGLDFGSNRASSQQQQPSPSPFSGLGSYSSPRSTTSVSKVNSQRASLGLEGGSFFDPPKPSSVPSAPSRQEPQVHSTTGFGDFNVAPSGPPPGPPPKPKASSGLGDLFDFSSPAAPTMTSKPDMTSPPNISSAFNLSEPMAPSQPKIQQVSNAPSSTAGVGSIWSNTDAWGSNDAWATHDNTSATTAHKSPPAATRSSNDFGGWGDFAEGANADVVSHASPPKVTGDEDFGGWSSAPPVASSPNQAKKPATGFGGSEDLFSNVWE
ncbi:MAG: hypothetical protein M1819_001833 [Sarea resinae]|nr:MAG: hypothetical protein M1819_001833 [Sarea resinae]